ncbi:hypothetical protein [Colwellia sp. MB3u-4]|uniref:hypothetical protein n=1 Tax=Colwellia sp. MB3u-4 TaxID=2759822 RepID=UPI0015F43F77|nr:hypothetical protein [Colwellia sp. MB3u-4]MBA6289980.1 hypothetical protein [Colwellia sp. MB3u-4]
MKITKTITLTIILLFSYSSFSSELDMTGIWIGESVTASEHRKIYTVRTRDGYYFSRHEYYEDDAMVRWLHNYGIWGQSDDKFWTYFVVYASATSVKNLPDCNPPRFSYIVQSIYQNKTTYVAERDGVEYTMARIDKLPIEFFTNDKVLHKFALEKINTFKQECRKEL